MKIQPIQRVVGIRIELSVDEALRIARDPARGEHMRQEVRAMLRGSGVDPDTGRPIESTVGLVVDARALPRPEETGLPRLEPAAPAARPADGKRVKRERVPCPHCGRKFGKGGGLGRHMTSCPDRPLEADDVDDDLTPGLRRMAGIGD